MTATPLVVSKAQLWTGRVLSGLPALLLLMDGVMKLVKPAFVVEKTLELGFPEDCILPLGVVLTLATLLYLFPRTAVLGAVLLTGYLGGAVAAHVRARHDLFQTLFPAIFGAILWVGLWLREPRLRQLTPWRQC